MLRRVAVMDILQETQRKENTLEKKKKQKNKIRDFSISIYRYFVFDYNYFDTMHWYIHINIFCAMRENTKLEMSLFRSFLDSIYQ